MSREASSTVSNKKINKYLLARVLKNYFTTFNLCEFELAKEGFTNKTIIVKIDNQKLVIRIYNRLQFSTHKRKKSGILWELEIIQFLRGKGLPVPYIVPSLNNRLLSTIDIGNQKYFIILSEFVNGRLCRKFNEAQRKELIYYQALMHKYLKNYKPHYKRIKLDQFVFEKKILKDKEIIKTYTNNSDLLMKLKNIVINFLPRLQRITKNCEKIIIHNDLNPVNLKFSGNKIVGIFDFDNALMGVCSAELGKTFFLLAIDH